MGDVKSLEQALKALDPSALTEFREWFAEFDAAAWDDQIDADATAGKIEVLLAEGETTSGTDHTARREIHSIAQILALP